MFKKSILIYFFTCILFATCGQTQTVDRKDQHFPAPMGWVNDFEDIFTAVEERSLDSLIKEYEKRTSIEIVVISIPDSLIGKEDFADLTLNIANNWGIGKKGKDNGILIALCKGRRLIRIQNGYGIEKRMTDLQTKEIIDQVIIPKLKEGYFYRGVFDGIEAIKKQLDKH